MKVVCKKDRKKFDKFVDLYNEYTEKLNLSNKALENKYKELTVVAMNRLCDAFKSKPMEAVAAAILLYACREIGHAITIR